MLLDWLIATYDQTDLRSLRGPLYLRWWRHTPRLRNIDTLFVQISRLSNYTYTTAQPVYNTSNPLIIYTYLASPVPSYEYMMMVGRKTTVSWSHVLYRTRTRHLHFTHTLHQYPTHPLFTKVLRLAPLDGPQLWPTVRSVLRFPKSCFTSSINYIVVVTSLDSRIGSVCFTSQSS